MSVSTATSNYLGMQFKQPWFVIRAAGYFSVALSNDPSISHFYSFVSDASDTMTFTIPDGCIDIFFDCDEMNPSVGVYGTRTRASYLDLPRGHRFVGVRFAPGFMPDFLKISSDELIDTNCDLLEVTSKAERLFELVVREKSFANQVALIKQFLQEKAAPRLSSKLTLPVVNKICAEKGNLCIKDLEALTGYTNRTLLRSFQRDMGMSPKAFARIIRCQSAVYKIHHDALAFSDLATDLGFSDQSHFLREFKQLVSTTPLDYQKQVRQDSFVQKMRYY